jgi:hypothetical protein
MGRVSWACLLFSAVAFPASGGELVELDLAKQSPGSTVTLSVGPTFRHLRVVNRKPLAAYEFEVLDEIKPIEPLDATGVDGAPAALAPSGTPCSTLLTTAGSLETATNEDEVGRLITKLEADIAAKTCNDVGTLTTVRGLMSRTVFDLPAAYIVRPGHTVTFRVTRSEGDKKLVWKLILDGGSRGLWLTSFGATFVPDRDETYFTQPTEDGKFAIVPEERHTGLKSVPSVFFSWLPASRQGSSWAFGPTAGLGVKGDRPAVFAGVTVTYNWNLGLVAGVAAVQETRLDGKYRDTTPPQVVAEPLQGDQLNQKVYRARWFVGVTFRFGLNPFGDGSGSAKDASQGEKVSESGRGK